MKQLGKLSHIRKLSKTFVNYVSKGIPFPTDLTFNFNTRTDSLINDTVSGLDAEVVGGYAAIFTETSNNVMLGNLPILAGVDNFKLEINFITVDKTSIQVLFIRSGTSSNWIQITLNISQLLIEINGNATSYEFTSLHNAIVNDIESCLIVDFNAANMGSNVLASLNGVDYIPETIPAIEPITTGVFTGSSYFGYTAISLTGSMIHTRLEISGVSVFDYYFNKHLINSLDGTITAINNGVEFKPNNTDKLPSTLSALNNGYYLEIATGIKVIDPQYPLPASGWVHILGGGVHNLIDSYIKFPIGIMDRSDVTRFNSVCTNSQYYDSAQPTLWHISELDFDTISSYQEAAYFDTIFAGYNVNYGDKTEMFEVFGYNTPKTNNDLIKVLNYCNYVFP